MKPQDQSTPPLRWLVLLAFAAALVLALLFSSQIYFSMIDHGHDWWRLFAWQLACWGFWAWVAPWVLRCGARLLRPRDRPRLWTWRLAATAIGLIGLHIVVATGALLLLQPYLPVASYTSAESLSRILGSWLKADPLIFLILLAAGYGLAGLELARRKELRESRLQAQLARAELEALRLEIQPHFLFNTLNGIAAQVRRGASEQALEMILGLSELLRATLEHSGGPLVPLGEELAFLRRYLDLQSLRFADRLEVCYDVPDDCLDAAVPFLLLQPLAENAITHGIGARADSGRIEIAASVDRDRLSLSISDDGAGLPPDFDPESTAGVGLGNTRAKLAQIYDGTATLEIASRAGGGTLVTVSLPLERVAFRDEVMTTA